MKPRAMFTAVVLAALLVLPQLVGAAPVHTFDCKNCHIPSLTVTQLGGGNVCLSCHSGEKSMGMSDGTTGVTDWAFGGLDASNAMGNNPYVVLNKGQTSHNWGASDTQVAAGAEAPSRTLHPEFYSRQGSSHGRVSCSRCHNPHGEDTNPQLLVKGPGSAETMCTACHVPFNKGADQSNITHPVGITYPVGDPLYQPTAPLENDGSISVDDGITLYGGKIVCGTCHQVHFVDSDPTTPDTPANWDNLSFNGGDGKTLRSYGRVAPVNNTPGAIYNSALLSSELCQTCHNYSMHGGVTASRPPGCQDCHGGHAKQGNYYMLRPEVAGLGYVPKHGTPGSSDPLAYTTLTASWMNGTGNGYCQGCHAIPIDGEGKHNGLSTGDAAACGTCHNHSGGMSGGCNSCHGYAPSTNTVGGTTGYAASYNVTANFKTENTTAHIDHSDSLGTGTGNYKFSCQQCHANFDTTHKNGSFQDVFFGNLAKTGMATLPSYDPAGNGSCANVYCHSNGGKRFGDGVRIYTASTTQVWQTGRDTINSCDVCHGNTAATMGPGGKDNSTSHAVHLNKGYTCNVCHTNTATSATALVTLGGDHVDGQHDIFFQTTYDLDGGTLTGGALGAGSYGDSTGTCGVYCHSNGIVQVTPDWDVASSGACGSCHQFNSGGAPAGTGAPLSGSHNAHVYTANGPKLGCTSCHTNNGSGVEHVNGHVSLINNIQTVCNNCHGATAATATGYDREPVWGNATSVECGTCHVDANGAAAGGLALINGRTAPAKNSFYTLGHGDAALTGEPNCAGCHTLTTDHIDGATDSNMLTGGVPANDAFCKGCHTSPAVQAHYATTGGSATGDSCASCHEPHGDGMAALGNTDVMLVVGKNFTDRTARASYWEADRSGVCQVCHEAAQVNYYNRTADPALAEASHNPGAVCTNCHKHDSTPAFKAGCSDCHGGGTTEAGTTSIWPDSGSAPDRLGSHDIHITRIAKQKFATATPTVAQKNATCDYCHPGGGHSGNGTVPAELGSFKNILGNANVQTATVSQPSDTNVSCSNVDCHYTTTMPLADWYSAPQNTAANCEYCHTYALPYVQGSLPDAHDKHMGETADNGRNMTCTNCHVSAADTGHQNGLIDFSTAAAPLEATRSIFAATGNDANQAAKYGAGTASTQFVSCSTLVCHGNFTGGTAANTPNWYNTDARIAGADNGDGACGSCHGSDSAATPTTNKHAVHLGSDTYVPGDCNDCHTKAAATHVYGTVTLGGNATVASAPNCTNACHTLDGLDNDGAVTGDNPSWTSANQLGCEDCHVSGKTWAGAGGALLTRGLPPASGKHGDHVGGYFAAGCVDCHSTNAVTHSTLNNLVEVDGSKVSVYAAGTCTNTCHTLNGVDNNVAGTDNATWTAVNLLGCVDCHTTGKAGLYDLGATDQAPTSGLHATTNAMAHDVQFLATAVEAAPGTATCTSCHATTVGSQHINTTGPTAFGAGGITYNFAASINSYTANGCAAACHLDAAANSGVGKWSRKWNGVIDAKPLATDNAGAAVCDNCHGDGIDKADGTTVNNVWNAGMVPGHLDSPDADTDIEMLAQHGNCKTCHGYGSDQYEEAWGGGSPTPFGHGDGKLNMNGPDATPGPAAGAQYDEDAFGCLSACHTGSLTDPGASNYNHTMSNSNWTIAYGDFPSSCFSCHGNGSNSYWPDGGVGAITPDKAGRHQKHIEALAAKLAITLPGDDAQQRAMCEYCHPGPAGQTDHLNSVVNVTSMKTLWDGSADDGVWTAGGDANNGTCATVDCHNNMTTPAGYSWYGASTSVCSMCHINAPAEQTHAAHLTASIYGLANKCEYCHDAATNWGTNTKPAANHINGTFNVSGTVALSYTGTYPTVKGSCGINACHNNGRNGAPSTAVYTWGSVTNSSCDFCHASPNTGHTAHFATEGVLVAPGFMFCTKCHPYNGSATNVDHMNANINVNAALNYSSTTLGVAAAPVVYGTCNTTTCHQDGRGTAVETPAWNGTGANCTVCHFNAAPAATFAHDTHIGTAAATQYNTAALNNSIAGEYRFTCAKCHGNTLANHLNSASWAAPTVNIAASAAYDAGADTCLNNACHNNGMGAGVGNDANLTANWTTGWVSDADSDKCNNCHGNSPDSNAHRVHAVGIHANDIYSGSTGLLTTATATKSHGDAATSTTINCNVCHSATVTMARNKFGSECLSCHSVNPTDATNVMAVANKAKHADGSKDVVFVDMTTFKSKAQLRDNLADADDGTTILAAIWNRIVGYKAATDYDKAQAAFATPIFAAGNCSNVACHNNNLAIWNERGDIVPAAYAPNCMGCHTSLPK